MCIRGHPIKQSNFPKLAMDESIILKDVCGTPAGVMEYGPSRYHGEYEFEFIPKQCYYIEDGIELHGDSCKNKDNVKKGGRAKYTRKSYSAPLIQCCFPSKEHPRDPNRTCDPKTRDRKWCQELGARFCPLHINEGDPFISNCKHWCNHFHEDCKALAGNICDSMDAINTTPLCKAWAEHECDTSDSKTCKTFCKLHPSKCHSKAVEECKGRDLWGSRCKEFCKKNPNICKPRKSSYCNLNINVDPFCLPWCTDENNHGWCDSGMDEYCKIHPESEHCTCLNTSFPDHIPARCDQACTKTGYKNRIMVNQPCLKKESKTTATLDKTQETTGYDDDDEPLIQKNEAEMDYDADKIDIDQDVTTDVTEIREIQDIRDGELPEGYDTWDEYIQALIDQETQSQLVNQGQISHIDTDATATGDEFDADKTLPVVDDLQQATPDDDDETGENIDELDLNDDENVDQENQEDQEDQEDQDVDQDVDQEEEDDDMEIEKIPKITADDPKKLGKEFGEDTKKKKTSWLGTLFGILVIILIIGIAGVMIWGYMTRGWFAGYGRGSQTGLLNIGKIEF